MALLAVLSFPRLASAQFNDEQPRVVAGPMLGISFANFRGASAQKTSSKTGFIAGGFVTYLFTPYFGIQPEVFYTRKGATFSDNQASSATATSITYLEIPILFKARYPIGEGRWPLTLSFVAGPAFGLLVNCNVEFEAGASEACKDIEATPSYPSPEPNGLDFSGIFGAGIDYNHVAFQVRYDLSITNSYPSSSQLAPIIKNVAWELTLGYKFALH